MLGWVNRRHQMQNLSCDRTSKLVPIHNTSNELSLDVVELKLPLNLGIFDTGSSSNSLSETYELLWL